MVQTGRVDPHRVFACVFAIVVHLVLLWMLARKIVVPAGNATGAAGALQVTWIEPPPPSPPPARVAPRPDAARPVTRSAPAAPAAPRIEAPATPPPAGNAPMSAVFIEQGRRLSRAPAGADAFAPDPLAHHAARLPGPGNDRFRMREPISPQRVLRAVGTLLAGPGYTTDPCPRVADNIGRLSQDGDSELLQEELRRKRALCD